MLLMILVCGYSKGWSRGKARIDVHALGQNEGVLLQYEVTHQNISYPAQNERYILLSIKIYALHTISLDMQTTVFGSLLFYIILPSLNK